MSINNAESDDIKIYLVEIHRQTQYLILSIVILYGPKIAGNFHLDLLGSIVALVGTETGLNSVLTGKQKIVLSLS